MSNKLQYYFALIESGDHASIAPEGPISNQEHPIGAQRDARSLQVPALAAFLSHQY